MEEAGTARIADRRRAGPPDALAVASWRTPADVALDLRYAPDEAEMLDPAPARIWEELVRSLPCRGAGVVSGYPVDDPYGGTRGADRVSEFFGVRITPDQLTFGAGVTSLLHALADLADRGRILAPELVHPDLEAWALGRGCAVELLREPPTCGRLVSRLEATQPALLHLDRPDFAGTLLGLDELEAVANAAARYRTALVIDESPAAYLGPAASAVQLVDQLDNIVVLRGFTKAYSWGGLRAGFAVASAGMAPRVRELVAPMQIGELALVGALALLAAGDVFSRLRARIHAMRPRAAVCFAALGLDAMPSHPDLPWIIVPDASGEASRALEGRGICGLRPASGSRALSPAAELLHLTLPLSDERLALLQRLTGTRAALDAR